MNALEKVKFKMELIKQTCQCIIKHPNGKTKTMSIELPVIKLFVDRKMLRSEEMTAKDKKRNKFTYDKIIYKDIEYIPIIDFELYLKDSKKFEDKFQLAYYHLYDELSFELLKDELKHDIEEFYKRENLEKHLTSSKSDYFNDYDKIYHTNLQKMVDISPEELEYIEWFKYHKINRFTAFLVLLYRNQNDKVFSQYDLTQKSYIKDLFEKFYGLYRKKRV